MYSTSPAAQARRRKRPAFAAQRSGVKRRSDSPASRAATAAIRRIANQTFSTTERSGSSWPTVTLPRLARCAATRRPTSYTTRQTPIANAVKTTAKSTAPSDDRARAISITKDPRRFLNPSIGPLFDDGNHGFCRRRSRVSASAASSRAKAARPGPERAGMYFTGSTVMQQGTGVERLDSFTPSPSASKRTVPLLQSVVPTGTRRSMVAVICTVTVPPTGMEPSHLTMLPTGVIVPLLAVAPTRVKPAGSESLNSGPGLSPWALGPLFVITKTLVFALPANGEPKGMMQVAVTPPQGPICVSSVALTVGPPGGVTDAVLRRMPVNAGETVPPAR